MNDFISSSPHLHMHPFSKLWHSSPNSAIKNPSPFRLGGRGSKNLTAALTDSPVLASANQQSPIVKSFYLYKGEPQPCIVQLLSKANGTFVQSLKPNPLNPNFLIACNGQIWTADDEQLYPVQLISRHLGLELISDRTVEEFVQSLHPNKRYAFPAIVVSPNIYKDAGMSLIYLDDDEDEDNKEDCQEETIIDTVTTTIDHAKHIKVDDKEHQDTERNSSLIVQVLANTSEEDLYDICSMVQFISQSELFTTTTKTITHSSDTMFSPAPTIATYSTRPPRPPTSKIPRIPKTNLANANEWKESMQSPINHQLFAHITSPSLPIRCSDTNTSMKINKHDGIGSDKEGLRSPVPSECHTGSSTLFTPTPPFFSSSSLCPVIHPHPTTLISSINLAKEEEEWEECNPRDLKEEFPAALPREDNEEVHSDEISIDKHLSVSCGDCDDDFDAIIIVNNDIIGEIDQKDNRCDDNLIQSRRKQHRLKPIKPKRTTKLRKQMTNLSQAFRVQ